MWDHQDYSPKAHNSGKLSELTEAVTPAHGSLVRTAACCFLPLFSRLRLVPSSYQSVAFKDPQYCAKDSSVSKPKITIQDDEYPYCYIVVAIHKAPAESICSLTSGFTRQFNGFQRLLFPLKQEASLLVLNCAIK